MPKIFIVREYLNLIFTTLRYLLTYFENFNNSEKVIIICFILTFYKNHLKLADLKL